MDPGYLIHGSCRVVETTVFLVEHRTWNIEGIIRIYLCDIEKLFRFVVFSLCVHSGSPKFLQHEKKP